MRQTWGEAQAPTLAASLHGADVAPEAAERVAAALDEYTARWTEVATSVCGSAKPAPGRRCLQRRRADLGAAVDVLSAADAEVAKRAIDVVLNLPPPDQCETIGGPAVPDNEELRTATAMARALLSAEQHRAAARQAREAIERVGGDAIVAREAYLVAGLAMLRGPESAEAEHLLRTAYFAAIETNDGEVATEAARAMSFLLVAKHGRLVEGERWIAYARASLQRRGDPPRQTALVMLDEADAMAQRGDVDAAWEHAQKARRIAAKDETARDDPGILLRMVTFAIVTGRYEVALQMAEEATERVARIYSRRHANYASARHQVAYALGYLGRSEEAIAAYTDAIDTVRWLDGPSSLSLARSLNNRAVMLRTAGHHDRAQHDLDAAAAILDANEAGPTHPLRVAVDTNAAESRIEQDDFAGALELYRDLLVRIEASVEPNVATSVALIHRNMARAEAGLGQSAKARAHLQRLQDEGLLELLSPATQAQVLTELEALQ